MQKQKSNLLGNSTTDVQFQQRIVYSRNEIELLHSVVEFPKFNFCVDHTYHGRHIAAGLDSHSKNLTFGEIRPLQLEETIRETLGRSAKSKNPTFWEIRPPMCNFTSKLSTRETKLSFHTQWSNFTKNLIFALTTPSMGGTLQQGLTATAGRNKISFSHCVVEFPKRLDFCLGLETLYATPLKGVQKAKI